MGEVKQQTQSSQSAGTDAAWHQSLFVQHPHAGLVLDRRGCAVEVNAAFTALFGRTLEEMRGQQLLAWVMPQQQIAVRRHLRAVFEGEAQTFVTKLQRPDGAIVDLDVAATPLPHADGMGACLFLRDITDALREQQELAEREAFYRVISENTLDGISSLDLDGTFTYVSPALHRMFGYTAEEMLGSSIFALCLPENKQETIEWFHDVVVKQDITPVMCPNLRKDGSIVWCETTCKRVLDPDTGEVLKINLVTRDVTERQATDEFLRRSEKLSVVGQLAAGVAHEIRNPLTSLKGFVQLLQEGFQKREYFELMHSELDRIQLIISEFLVLSKPQAITYYPRDLKHVLSQVVTLLETQAILSNVAIELTAAASLPTVLCDENQLKQVFINFMKNAIEAMPAGGRLQIVLGTTADGVQVQVRDEGVGIPPELLEHLGEPFFTTKEHGTGLGLMISSKIIEEHGGRVQFQSVVGEGTVVTVHLPSEGSKKRFYLVE